MNTQLQLEPERVYKAIEEGIYRAFKEAINADLLEKISDSIAAAERPAPKPYVPPFNNEIPCDE